VLFERDFSETPILVTRAAPALLPEACFQRDGQAGAARPCDRLETRKRRAVGSRGNVFRRGFLEMYPMLILLRMGVLTTMLAIVSSVVQAACIRQSLPDHDYCGPEGRALVSFLIADRLYGPFTGACAAHDYCYWQGGIKIVTAMEQRYRMSMAHASDAQIAEFRFAMDGIKAQCDWNFRMRLLGECRSLAWAKSAKCEAAAELYFLGVDKLATGLFRSAVNAALTCR